MLRQSPHSRAVSRDALPFYEQLLNNNKYAGAERFQRLF